MDRLRIVVQKLQDRKIRVVSEKTGLSYQSIRNISKGINVNPTLDTLEKLERYLNECK